MKEKTDHTLLYGILFIVGTVLVALWYASSFPFDPAKSYIENLRFVLEMFYFVSGIALVTTILVALRQLSIARKSLLAAKKDSDQRAKHETAMLTLKACDAFSDRIIIMCAELDRNMRAVGLRMYRGPVAATFMHNEQSLEWIQAFNAVESAQIENCRPGQIKYEEQAVVFLNSLETFAVRFTEKYCDEDLAFKVHGKLFCDYVQMFYPLLVKYRRAIPTDYEPIVELYSIWSRRLHEGK